MPERMAKCPKCDMLAICANKDENICRECNKVRNKKSYYNVKKTINVSQLTLDPNKNKLCSLCKKNKPETEFHLAKNKGVIRSSCIECNKEKRKVYYEKNKEKIIKQTTSYTVERMKTDSAFKIVIRQRNRVYHALAKQRLLKKQKTLDLIGCKPVELVRWLEFQMFDGIMTLENYGKVWHVDHVRPCTSFDLTNKIEMNKCFHWMNLRPCLINENLKKSKNYTIRDLLFQELRVKIWLKINK